MLQAVGSIMGKEKLIQPYNIYRGRVFVKADRSN